MFFSGEVLGGDEVVGARCLVKGIEILGGAVLAMLDSHDLIIVEVGRGSCAWPESIFELGVGCLVEFNGDVVGSVAKDIRHVEEHIEATGDGDFSVDDGGNAVSRPVSPIGDGGERGAVGVAVKILAINDEICLGRDNGEGESGGEGEGESWEFAWWVHWRCGVGFYGFGVRDHV